MISITGFETANEEPFFSKLHYTYSILWLILHMLRTNLKPRPF